MYRLIICALAISEPETMGGNSKITLELARHLQKRLPVHFFVLERKLATITNNLSLSPQLIAHPLKTYPRNEFRHPLAATRYYRQLLEQEFRALKVGPNDLVFSCSDFHLDVLPIYSLQKRFGFSWIATFFLFLPTLWENLRHHYSFPPLKYAICRIYQRILFYLLKRRARAFVITNDTDKIHFPPRFKNRLLALYGGVNCEQIPKAPLKKTRDVIFCGRLHPQKGILKFLNAWKLIHAQLPSARLTIIGNGAPDYEALLKKRAQELGLSPSIEWLGYVNNNEKYALYRSAKVFIHPTIYDNNGMVAAEALCSGLPVVLFDLPTLRHVYTIGCRKIPFGDYPAMATEIIQLLQNDSYRAKYAPQLAQINHLQKKWSWAYRADLFWHWLQSILNEEKT